MNLHCYLLAVRPDRLLYLSFHCSSRMIDTIDDENKIRVPVPSTKPAFLLEPMIANALCQSKSDEFDLADNSQMQGLLREIIEKCA